MKILTNVTREYLGGITRSNLNFIETVNKQKIQVVGIELNARKLFMTSHIFRHLDVNFFKHYILNIYDKSIVATINKSKSIKEVEKIYKQEIEIIKNILKEEKPDVVFLNGTYYIPWIISIAAKELKIPIVLRYAGIYTKETENFKPKQKKIFSEIEKSFQSRVGTFIFPSLICKNMVEKEVIHKTISNSYIIPNSVNLRNIKTVERINKKSIASVGRWDKIKNFEAYFDLHKSLSKTGWQHTASILTSDAKDIKIPKTINRIKPMSYTSLFDFYKKQGLIISTSSFETFGNVPMEAVCVGVPVLVNSTMGCSELLIESGLHEMVISYNDNMDQIMHRVKNLCGKKVDDKKIKLLRKKLDPKLINIQILKILKDVNK